MEGRLSDLELLELHRQTGFSFDPSGRMVHQNAPDRSRGQRFLLAGCRQGNLAVVRDDVTEVAAKELARLVAAEPPLWSRDMTPVGAKDYLAVLESGNHNHGLVWSFPSPLTYSADAGLVWSGTPEGYRLLDRFAEAMPESLREIGFREVTDIWAPWCVAMIGDRIASIAETVRRGPGGAEVGVDTGVEFRGRGLGAAATAGWSEHPDLHGLTLFYSTDRTNVSSQRVTDRLGLRFLGSTFAVP